MFGLGLVRVAVVRPRLPVASHRGARDEMRQAGGHLACTLLTARGGQCQQREHGEGGHGLGPRAAHFEDEQWREHSSELKRLGAGPREPPHRLPESPPRPGVHGCATPRHAWAFVWSTGCPGDAHLRAKPGQAALRRVRRAAAAPGVSGCRYATPPSAWPAPPPPPLPTPPG